MGSIKIKLRQGKGTIQNIYFHFNYGRKKQYRYATGLSVKKIGHWNPETNTVKNVLAEPESNDINLQISNLMKFSTELLRDLEKEDIPIDNHILKQRINQFRQKGESKKKTYYFTEHYKWFIDHYETKPRPSTQKPLAKGTFKPYRNSLRILEGFENKKRTKLTFQHITLSFHSEFIQYLQDQDFSDNYIGSQIKNLKTIMNDGLDRGLHKNLDFQKSAFTKPKEEINHIYLTMDEIAANKKIDYSGRPDMNIARDLFIIASVTGLRVSDYKKLTASNIQTYNNIKYLEIKTHKTGKVVNLPLHPFVLDILKKRNNQFPEMIPEQKINEKLKSIGKKAKLKEEIIVKRTIAEN